MKLGNFIHGNIAGQTIAMKKITGSINVVIPALTRPTQILMRRDIVHPGYPKLEMTRGNIIPIQMTYQSHLFCATP